jgi:dihydrofolate synthase/folylpolyglutamate synthase
MQTLADVFKFYEDLPYGEIDLSLERVKEAAERLNLSFGSTSVITIAGTNGKGSTAATLEKVYTQAGFKIGCYSSPYLFSYLDQIKINCIPITVDCLIFNLLKVHTQSIDLNLTKFEYATLIALTYFQAHKLDLLILEVGLGGRYDAVNVISADIAIITSIALDHTEWLGETREKIGFEKAGIMRAGAYAISGDDDTPLSILSVAEELKCHLLLIHAAFHFKEHEDVWDWCAGSLHFDQLPKPNLQLSNVSCALMAVTLLQDRHPVSSQTIRQALFNLTLPGRIEWVSGPVNQIFDVAHNPAAAAKLVQFCQKRNIKKARAVFSMLKEKDMLSTVQLLSGIIEHWYVAELDNARKTDLMTLQDTFAALSLPATFFRSIPLAYAFAWEESKAGEVLIVFGSFATVAETYNLRQP